MFMGKVAEGGAAPGGSVGSNAGVAQCVPTSSAKLDVRIIVGDVGGSIGRCDGEPVEGGKGTRVLTKEDDELVPGGGPWTGLALAAEVLVGVDNEVRLDVAGTKTLGVGVRAATRVWMVSASKYQNQPSSY